MTAAQVVETSVTNNSSFQNYPHPDDHTIRITDIPGFKPFTMLQKFSLQNKHKSLCVKLAGERILFIHSAKLKKFSTLKNTLFPLNQSIKVHRRALVLLPCLIPCLRCEKSARKSRNSHHLITQRDNIHARAQGTCVNQRGYMTSGWRNLF